MWNWIALIGATLIALVLAALISREYAPRDWRMNFHYTVPASTDSADGRATGEVIHSDKMHVTEAECWEDLFMHMVLLYAQKDWRVEQYGWSCNPTWRFDR